MRATQSREVEFGDLPKLVVVVNGGYSPVMNRGHGGIMNKEVNCKQSSI